MIIWTRHVNEKIESCSYYVWIGKHCDAGCTCEREGLIVSGGIQHRENYGYIVPFEYNIIGNK